MCQQGTRRSLRRETLLRRASTGGTRLAVGSMRWRRPGRRRAVPAGRAAGRCELWPDVRRRRRALAPVLRGDAALPLWSRRCSLTVFDAGGKTAAGGADRARSSRRRTPCSGGACRTLPPRSQRYMAPRGRVARLRTGMDQDAGRLVGRPPSRASPVPRSRRNVLCGIAGRIGASGYHRRLPRATDEEQHRGRSRADVGARRGWPAWPKSTAVAGLVDKELGRPARRAGADRVRELHLARRDAGDRLGAHQQVRRGLSRQALLRRLRSSTRSRARHRPGEGAVRRRHANVQPHAGARPTWRRTLRCSSPATRCWA